MKDIAFIGLGRMGAGMAARLVKAGHGLTVFNRSADKAAPIVALGAEQAHDAQQAVQPGGVLITMLADDDAVHALVDDALLQRLGNGGVHLSMSTLSAAGTTRLTARHAALGVDYLACPVFGRPDAAAAGKLWLSLAGPAAAKARVAPLLDVMGQKVFDFGTEPAAASVVKLAGNFLIAAAIESMSEAFSFGAKHGVAPAALHELFSQTLFSCPIYQNYGGAIVEARYRPAGFAMSLGAKDLRLVREAARQSETPMPFAAVLEDRFLRSLANARGDWDWTAIALDQWQAAGMDQSSTP